MSKIESQSRQHAVMHPVWSRHKWWYGWVCHCGYHGKTIAGRDVHERRAFLGFGCKPAGAQNQKREVGK